MRAYALRRSRAASRSCCGSCRSATIPRVKRWPARTARSPCRTHACRAARSRSSSSRSCRRRACSSRATRRSSRALLRIGARARARHGPRRAGRRLRAAARRPRGHRRWPRARGAARAAARARGGLPYVGLVASRKRGQGVLGELRATASRRSAGADRHAGRPGHRRRARRRRSRSRSSRKVVAVRRADDGRAPATRRVDPVCGMTVAAVAARPRSSTRARRVYFCCEGCKAAFEAAGRSMPPSPADARSSPGSCWARAARGASASPSSCCPTATARCSATWSASPVRAGFDQLVVAIGGAADDVRARSTWPAPRWSSTTPTARAARRRSPPRSSAVDPRCDVLVLMLGDQPGVTAETVAALLAGRGDAPAGRVPLRRRPRPPDRVRARACSARSPTCTATRACGGCSTSAATRSSRCRSRARSRSTSTRRRTTRRSSRAGVA